MNEQHSPGTQPSHQQPPQNFHPRPVAYDAQGRPLYAAPPQPQQPYVAQHQPVATSHQQAQQQPAPHQERINTPQQASPSKDPHHSHFYERGTSSHVTATHPGQIEGHNFDPRTRVQYGNEPDIIHTTRPLEPVVPVMSDELRKKHEDSQKKFPFLNLSPGEFVIMYLHRHPIGLFAPVAITVLIIVTSIALMVAYPMLVDLDTAPISLGMIVLVAFCMIALAAIGGYVAVWVYLRNMFFLTNESVIQEIQMSLFAKREQTVSLGSIEDASFLQPGFWATMFNYGTVRLSTEGEETTYKFHFVSNPKHQVAILNNAVEAFKNGRPVNEDIH